MSEVVGYEIRADGFASRRDVKKFERLLKRFDQTGTGYVDHISDTSISYHVPHGRRGTGMSCEEIVREAFGAWLEQRSYISVEFRFSYIEQVPTETLRFKDGEWKEEGGCP